MEHPTFPRSVAASSSISSAWLNGRGHRPVKASPHHPLREDTLSINLQANKPLPNSPTQNLPCRLCNPSPRPHQSRSLSHLRAKSRRSFCSRPPRPTLGLHILYICCQRQETSRAQQRVLPEPMAVAQDSDTRLEEQRAAAPDQP